jgi:hypothetical protein
VTWGWAFGTSESDEEPLTHVARMARGLEEAHRRNSVRAYRRHGDFWMALGATAVLFGLLAFLWAVA